MTGRLNSAAVAERLTAMAPRLAPGATRIDALDRLTGGASMEIWAFTAIGDAVEDRLILRRIGDAPVARSASLRREASVIAAALAAGVPVPEVVYLCDPQADGLGDAYVMRHVPGETLGKRIVGDPAFAPARDKLARQCGAALARIHATNPPPGLECADAAATLAEYEAQWRAAQAVRPTIEAGFRWLEKRLPEDPVTPRLVHGDFRTGNIMVDPDHGLTAVLDWELTRVGDPAEDLGWLCTNSWRFGRPDRMVGGFGDLADLLAGYEEAGGLPIHPTRVDFWSMLGSLKWGVMTTQMYASFAADPLAGPERGVIGRRLSEVEADIVAIMARRGS